MESIRIEQLMQIFNGAIRDGNLISKSERDALMEAGFVKRVSYGYNIRTEKVVEYVAELEERIESNPIL